MVGGARLATAAGSRGTLLSFYVLFLTFRENAYLAVVVKLQEERGQTVVSTGPYRYVRHPMYAGMFLFLPSGALLVGSWWGLLLCLVLLGLPRLEDPSRRADTRERTSRIRRVRTEGEVPPHLPRSGDDLPQLVENEHGARATNVHQR